MSIKTAKQVVLDRIDEHLASTAESIRVQKASIKCFLDQPDDFGELSLTLVDGYNMAFHLERELLAFRRAMESDSTEDLKKYIMVRRQSVFGSLPLSEKVGHSLKAISIVMLYFPTIFDLPER